MKPGNLITRHLGWLPKLLGLASLVYGTGASAAAELRIDFARTNGTLRALHGINKGPLVAGGFIDLTAQHRALGIPFTRLHDCHWPNPDVVDIHAVFPDFTRDPEKPSSYDFRRTDEYLAAIQKTGAKIIYRLGESIEHESYKRFVHPPADVQKWARICLGLIRHYNEGWANGFRHDIRYWEIWNEPENRPVMWTGTDEQFLQLYGTAAREIKMNFPQLKVGGPGFGYTGDIRGGEFRAGGLLTNFLARCRREALPLDFLSWHCYTDDPREMVVRSKGIRRLLDTHGFTKAESHLNEWNYLPGNTWMPISRTRGTPESRQKFHDEMSGAPGASFLAAALMQLQDAPVDVANLFHGEAGAFGLFNENGVPLKSYLAVKAFQRMLKTPRQVTVEGGSDSITVTAGLNQAGTEAAILLANTGRAEVPLNILGGNLPWRAPTIVETRLLDRAHDFEEVKSVATERELVLSIAAPGKSVLLVTLRPAR